MSRLPEWTNQPGVDHVAYCTGPAQLAHLLAALECARVPAERCRIILRPGGGNEGLGESMAALCRELGLGATHYKELPAGGSLGVVLSRYAPRAFRRLAGRRPRAFWYSMGVLGGTGAPMAPPAYDCACRTRPRYLIEYYDGLRSFVPASVQHGGRDGRRSLVSRVSDWPQRMMRTRVMAPDWYYMPDAPVWRERAPLGAQKRASLVPLESMRAKARLVGRALEPASPGPSPFADSAGMVLTAGLVAERNKRFGARLCDEIRLYDDALRAVRGAASQLPILIKAHPRSSADMMRRLETVAATYGARTDVREQLLEFILDESPHSGFLVFGPPSTALLNTVWLGYGTAACPSLSLLGSYVGQGYLRNRLAEQDHAVMVAGGVREVQELSELVELAAETARAG